MQVSKQEHSGHREAGRRRLAWLPFTLALLVAALLLTWQRLYFEMQDVRRDALGEAESIMTVIELSRAMSTTDAAPWLTSASSRFSEVVSSSYCLGSQCTANYRQRGSALCSAGDQWDSVCVQSFPRGTSSAYVEVRHSLIPAYQATLRDLLVVSIVGLLGLGTWFSAEQRLRQQVLRRDDQLRHAARHDALTGLLNRAAFDEVLAAHVGKPKAERVPATLLYMDLDGFKHLNDTHGHHMGDLVLREVTRRFAQALPDARSSLGRLGGDEFALILPGVSEPLAVAASVDSLTESLVAPFEAEQMSAQLGVSIGAVALDAEVDAIYPGYGFLSENAGFAQACADNGIPFYVAAPRSTLDFACPEGADIPIEERDGDEFRLVHGLDQHAQPTALRQLPAGEDVANPAFDVTPNWLVKAIITERGACAASREGLLALYPEEARG